MAFGVLTCSVVFGTACGGFGSAGERSVADGGGGSGAPADTVRLGTIRGEFIALAPTDPQFGRAQLELRLGPPDEPRVVIVRDDTARLAPGRYPLVAPVETPFDSATVSPVRADTAGGPYATYRVPHRAEGDTARRYASADGELVVTHSTPGRVAGTLRFTGAEYWASWPSGFRGSGRPSAPTPGGPRVVVVGGFAATPPDPGPVVCAGTGGPPIAVEVRDAGGRPAALGATLVIEDGAFRDSGGSWSGADSLFLGAGNRRPGRYAMRVTKPGYSPAGLRDVIAEVWGDPRCGGGADAGLRPPRVTLTRAPGAPHVPPRVYSVVVAPRSLSYFGRPGGTVLLRAQVDADPGLSRAVRWRTSAPAVAAIRATTSSTATLVMPCRPGSGEALVTATSAADPRVRGVSRIHAAVRADPRAACPP